MNNQVQRRFDRSIREAVETTQRTTEAKPRRDVTKPRGPKVREQQPQGRLYLDPETGATIWEPK